MIRNGFTLIEMLVVLTIVALLAAVALPRLGYRPASVDHGRLLTALNDAVSRARLAAATTGRPMVIDLDGLGSKDVGYLPEFIAAAKPLVYPDGTTTGGRITVAGKPVIAIAWTTGRLADANR